jgi:fused signal recognition particle receptor
MTEKKSFFSRLRERLNRSDSWLTRDLGELFSSNGQLDEDALEELEDRLLMADVGVDATGRLIEGLRRRVAAGGHDAGAALCEEIADLLAPVERPLEIAGAKPFVILVVGVNGSGKTTTIGKLAKRFRDEGRSVMLAAGDTFRAAAVEQLKVWGERNEVPVIAHGPGADSAAVIHDAVQAARSRGVEVLLADTAGRLHTQAGLMDELAKVRRVIQRLMPEAPHETLLVLDGSTGQNALAQARRFNQAVPLSGIAVTKLDGTARGGIVLAVARELAVPLRYIGIGEAAEDLDVFRAREFAEALVQPEKAGA